MRPKRRSTLGASKLGLLLSERTASTKSGPHSIARVILWRLAVKLRRKSMRRSCDKMAAWFLANEAAKDGAGTNR